VKRIVFLLLFLLLLGFLLPPPSPAASRKLSVAVLPFVGEEKELGVALAEVLGHILSKVNSLSVIESGLIQNLLEQEDQKEDDPVKVGKALKTDLVISGRFTTEGDHLKLNVFSLNIESNQDSFSDEVKGQVQELFSLQEQVAKDIIQYLQLNLSSTEEKRVSLAARKPTASLQAYIFYAQGRRLATPRVKEDQKEDEITEVLVKQAGQESRFEEAIKLFQKALALDGRFALAHYELALALQGAKAYMSRANAMAELEKTIQIDPQLTEAYIAFGNLLRLTGERLRPDLDRAIKLFQKAVELDPELIEAYTGLAETKAAIGEFDEAIAEYRKALTFDPDNPRLHYGLGGIYAGKGLYQEAIAKYQKATTLDQKFVEVYLALGGLYHERGLYQEAVASYRRAAEIDPSRPDASYGLALTLERVDMEQAIATWMRYIQLASDRPSERDWVDIAKKHLKKLQEKLKESKK